MWKDLASVMRGIFNAPDIDIAWELVNSATKTYQDSASDFVKWIEENIEDGLTFFQFPEPHHKRIRTVNAIRKLNQEIMGRTRVVRLFPDVESCLRQVSAILAEINDEWVSGWMYLSREIRQSESPESRINRKDVV